MSSESRSTLAPGTLVATRFRADTALESADGDAFLGTEAATGAPVVLLVLSAEHARTLEHAKAVEHRHLGRLLDVVKLEDGRDVAVAARIDGQTLEERVRSSGKKEPVAAVRTALRVADALHALHEAGATHGFVHARSVVVAPEGAEPPVLAWVPAAEPKPWRAPEHAAGSPSAADDAWAAAALLHLMLTGSAPPPEGYATAGELEQAGVSDEALREALLHGLRRSPEGRGSLHDLKRELARWFVDHAGEEPVAPGPHQAPPPLPAVSARSRPPAAFSHPPPPRHRRRRYALIALAAIALGLLASYAFVLLRPNKVKLVQLPPAEEPPASAAPIELGDVPVTGEQAPATGQKEKPLGNRLAACVAQYMPKGSFAKAPELDWLCTETDPRVGGEKLHGAVVVGAPRATTTDAMKIFARIGWYDMAAFAMVRAGCCSDAAPIAIPEGKAECAMDTALRGIGEAVVASGDVKAAVQKYTESIHCELNRGGAKTLRRSGRPEGGEDTAFLGLVEKLE